MALPDYGREPFGGLSLGRFARAGTTPAKISASDAEGRTAQVDTITFTGPGNQADFSVDILNKGQVRTIAFTSQQPANATNAAEDLVAAVEADVLASGLVTATSAAGVVTLTWGVGLTGTVALRLNPGTAMALVTTAAAAAPQYRFGYIVEFVAANSAGDNFIMTQVQRPSGSGTQFGYVYDSEDAAPRDLEEVAGPIVGGPMTVIPANGASEDLFAVATLETSVTDGGAVYAGSAGAEQGLAYTSAGAGRVLVPGSTFHSVASTGVAYIRP
jgi:hypothetical protein